MDNTTCYTAHYRRDRESPGFWLGEIGLLPGLHTYGRTLREVQSRMREALRVWLDIDDLTAADIEVIDEVAVGGLSEDLQSLAVDRLLLEQQSEQVVARTRWLAHRLVLGEELSLRDAATALRLSHQRVAQFLDQNLVDLNVEEGGHIPVLPTMTEYVRSQTSTRR